MTFDFEKWDQEVDEFERTNKQRLYDQMKTLLAKGENSDVLWRLAKICLVLSFGAERDANKVLQKKLVEESLGYGKRSCELNPNCIDCHKWYCMAIGANCKFVSVRQKIKLGQEFKQHIHIVLKSDPNDYLVHYMFGRFCYELSSLTWIERKIANTLFGSVPTSSFDEAIKEFTICDKLKPKWKSNYFWVAKTLIAKKNYTGAKQWIRLGLQLPILNILDEMAQKSLTDLKSKHKL